MVEKARPTETKRKKILRGSALWGVGAGLSAGLGEGCVEEEEEARSEESCFSARGLSSDAIFTGISSAWDFSLTEEVRGLLTGRTAVCFL